MADIEQYKQALIRAHKKGDIAAARFFAGKVRDGDAPVSDPELRPEQSATLAEQDFIPTQENLAIQPEKQETPTMLERVSGGLETAFSIVSSAIAEPISGLAGAITAPFAGVDEAVKNIESVKDFLTFSPRSEQSKQQLQAIGKAIQPVAEGLKKIESTLGNAVLDATGSPELAAVAHSLPTAALELIGVKGLRGAKSPLKGQKLSNNVAEAIRQSAPDIETINKAKTAAYDQLDNFGIKVQPKIYDNFADNLAKKLKAEGIDPILTPKANAALTRILNDKGSAKSLQELDTLRKIARGAANDIDKTESSLGSIIINELDNGLEKLSTEIGGKFKEARGLAQRGFKSQSINDMIENASHTASGMENGLRIEARKILKNPKKRRGFTGDELKALKEVEQGTTTANLAKFLGKFGISEGQATSMLGFSIGAGGGGALGSMFGPVGAAVGAVTIPAIGQFAKKTAQRITLNNTKFADDLARSGKNAKGIVRAYLKHVPVKSRNVNDLTDLLLDPNINPADIKSLPSATTEVGKLVSDAKFFAEEIKRRAKQATSAAVITTPQIQEQQ